LALIVDASRAFMFCRLEQELAVCLGQCVAVECARTIRVNRDSPLS